MDNQTTTNNRILKNTIFLYLRMIVLLIVTLYTSRVTLKYLGITDYGIYNVVAGIVSFVAFFNNTLLCASQRFITCAISDGVDAVKKAFNASMFTHIVLSIILIVGMESVGLWFLHNKLVIPIDRMSAALWAFHTSVVIGVFTILKSPYGAIIIAYEKMDVYAYFSIVETILKLVIVYCLVISSNDALIVYSVLLMFVGVGMFVWHYLYCKKNFRSQSTFDNKIDRGLLKDIFKFIGWSSYGGIACLGYTQGLNVLLNLFFGPTVNAARGVAIQVDGAIRQFRSSFQMAVNPQLIISYTKQDFQRYYTLTSFSAKFSTYIILAFTVPLFFRVDWLLNKWLVEVPTYTSDFLQMILLAGLAEASSQPFLTGIQANGNVKLHEIVNGTLLLLILPISYFFLKLGSSPTVVFAVYAFFILITLIARIVIFCNQIPIKVSFMFKLIYKDIIIVSILCFLLGYCVDLLLPDSILIDAMYDVLLFVIVIVVSYFLGVTSQERNTINGYVKRFINRFRL